jgi:hypothetical protein
MLSEKFEVPVEGALLRGEVIRRKSSASSRGPVPRTLLILAHPYSKLGGCASLLRRLAADIVSNKRFDDWYGKGTEEVLVGLFDGRGAGRSTGSSTVFGNTEVGDYVQVGNHLMSSYSPSNLFVCGSSAGAVIGGSALSAIATAHPSVVRGYVSIAYPFGWFSSILFSSHYKRVLSTTGASAAIPKLFLLGSDDGFTSPSQLRQVVGRAAKTLPSVDSTIAPFKPQLNELNSIYKLKADRTFGHDDDEQDTEKFLTSETLHPTLHMVFFEQMKHFELETGVPEVTADVISQFVLHYSVESAVGE